MATAIDGINKLLYIREKSQAESMDGTRLAFQTTHTLSGTADTNSTSTKDGTKNTRGTATWTMDAEMLGSDDPTYELLEDAFNAGSLLEFWEVDFNKPGDGQNEYESKYFQGVVTDFSNEDPSDDNETLSYTVAINGVPQKGTVELEKQEVDALQYAFTDIKASNNTDD